MMFHPFTDHLAPYARIDVRSGLRRLWESYRLRAVHRRSVTALRELDDRLLRDVGLTPSERGE